MKDIIHYYEDGGPSNATARESAEMKRQAKDWIKMLKKEFYDQANPLGRQGMYLVLKKKANKVIGNYPTKRFVAAFFALVPAVIAIAGGDRDSYGCIRSAGYVWCDDPEVQRCIRIWEEVCDTIIS